MGSAYRSGGGGGGGSGTRLAGASALSPKTPTRRNLFSYQSPGSASRTRERSRGGEGVDLMGGGSRIRAYGATTGSSDSPGGPPSLFSGSSMAGDVDTLDSPLHKAYSTSPVKAESQRLLQSPRRTPRMLSKVPFKVLDAPELAVSARSLTSYAKTR